jgi:hypothetical protein
MEESLTDPAAGPTQCNIEAISRLGLKALDRRTTTERASDSVVKLVGSIKFLLPNDAIHLLRRLRSERPRYLDGQEPYLLGVIR